MSEATATERKAGSTLDALLEKKSRKIEFDILEDEKVPGSRWRYKVKVGDGDVTAMLEEVLREFGRHVAVPGFRPGKAPAQMVRKRYERHAREELVKRMTPRLVELLGERQGQEPLGQPLLLGFKSTAEEGTSVEVAFEIRPKFEITRDALENIEFEATRFIVDDAAVAKALENLRERNASFDPVDDAGYAYREGDGLLYNLKVTDEEGSDIPFQYAGEDIYAQDAKARFPKEASAALAGRKAGESFVVDVSLPRPGAEGEEPLKLKFHMTVLSIRSRRLPELTDTFAVDVDPKVENLAELRAKAKESLTAQGEDESHRRALREVYKTLRERIPFEVPRSLLEQNIRRGISDVEKRLNAQGLSLNYVDEGMRNNLVNQIAGNTERDMRDYFLADAISKFLKLEPTETQIEAELERRAKAASRKAMAIRAQLEARKEWDQFLDDLRIKVTNDHLIDSAKISWKEKSLADNTAEDDHHHDHDHDHDHAH